MNSATSPGYPNREKYTGTQPNVQEDSRYSLRYPHNERHFSTDTAGHSRYSSNQPYTKNRTSAASANFRDEEYSPRSSNYSNTRRYNDDVSKVDISHSSRYSGSEMNMNRHSFESEHNKRSRLETHSPRYPHSERYAPSEVKAIDDMAYSAHFSQLERNERSRPETFASRYSHTERYAPSEVNAVDDMRYSSHLSHSGRNEYPRPKISGFEDSTILSRKYMPTSPNATEDLEYSSLYRHKLQNVPIEMGTGRDYAYLSHNLYKKTRMNTVDVRDPIYPTYMEKKKLTGMEIDEDSAFLSRHGYTRKDSAFVSLPHRGRSPPIVLDNVGYPPRYFHSERSIPSNLDGQFLRKPRLGRYTSIDQDPSGASSTTEANLQYSSSPPTSRSLERTSGNGEFDKIDDKALPPRSKKKFICEFCGKKFWKRYPLHMHMVDKHNANDGKYIPSIKKVTQPVVWKDLMHMKREAFLELQKKKSDAKVKQMQMNLEGESCEPDLPLSKREKCPLCNKSVRAMHRHMNGVHNPKFKFKCDICHKTFQKDYQLKSHRKGKGTNKCLPKALRAKAVVFKSFENSVSASSHSTNLNENMPIKPGVADESSDLSRPNNRDIPTEVSTVKNPPSPAAELRNSKDPSNSSTTETGITAVEKSTESSSHSSASHSTDLHKNLPIKPGVAEELSDLSHTYNRDIPTGVGAVENPPSAASDLPTEGEIDR